MSETFLKAALKHETDAGRLYPDQARRVLATYKALSNSKLSEVELDVCHYSSVVGAAASLDALAELCPGKGLNDLTDEEYHRWCDALAELAREKTGVAL